MNHKIFNSYDKNIKGKTCFYCNGLCKPGEIMKNVKIVTYNSESNYCFCTFCVEFLDNIPCYKPGSIIPSFERLKFFDIEFNIKHCSKVAYIVNNDVSNKEIRFYCPDCGDLFGIDWELLVKGVV